MITKRESKFATVFKFAKILFELYARVWKLGKKFIVVNLKAVSFLFYQEPIHAGLLIEKNKRDVHFGLPIIKLRHGLND